MDIKAVGISTVLLLASTSAFAQSSTVTGAAGGAATGAVVGGELRHLNLFRSKTRIHESTFDSLAIDFGHAR
jgi:hypothetical protein